jgi:hypothetical protein
MGRSTIIMGVLAFVLPGIAVGQNAYEVISVSNPGTITGTVKWSGPQPRTSSLPINKDIEVCDPNSAKKRDLERLVIGPEAGVANTVVYLKDVSRGKAMDIPESRRLLDQKHCHYEPHILLVPQNSLLQMKSSDPVLHTVHMDGAASFNLPFPFQNRIITRNMERTGLVNLKCNGGHVWMNAEMFVIPHPYYAVTDETGRFELTGVPAGTYELMAWHEGWGVLRSESSFDVLTERRVSRPIFSDPKTWEKRVTVGPSERLVVNFSIGEGN